MTKALLCQFCKKTLVEHHAFKNVLLRLPSHLPHITPCTNRYAPLDQTWTQKTYQRRFLLTAADALRSVTKTLFSKRQQFSPTCLTEPQIPHSGIYWNSSPQFLQTDSLRITQNVSFARRQTALGKVGSPIHVTKKNKRNDVKVFPVTWKIGENPETPTVNLGRDVYNICQSTQHRQSSWESCNNALAIHKTWFNIVRPAMTPCSCTDSFFSRSHVKVIT